MRWLEVFWQFSRTGISQRYCSALALEQLIYTDAGARAQQWRRPSAEESGGRF